MTRRQSVLLDRLVTFCERCGSPDLPWRIERVLGYGSFFRGKGRPGDVDLVARVGARHPLFNKFRDLVVEKVRTGRAPEPPAERMDRIAASHPDPAVNGARALFVSWLAGLTEHGLFGHT